MPDILYANWLVQGDLDKEGQAICSFAMLCAASICMLRYCTDYSLLTTHYSTDYSLLTTHYSLIAARARPHGAFRPHGAYFIKSL